jgi:hypothetical protein
MEAVPLDGTQLAKRHLIRRDFVRCVHSKFSDTASTKCIFEVRGSDCCVTEQRLQFQVHL